jgi:3-oxoadipate enol-lactonase
MQVFEKNGMHIHYREEGDPNGEPLVFSNSLGTDMRLWDQIMPLLPKGLRIIRYDMRGHGLTDCPDAPYSMGALISDAESLLDHLEVRDCLFVGLSIGGMVAQGLAAKRLDLIRTMVLSNTAAKIATPAIWKDRIDSIRAEGIGPVSDATMGRWFSPKMHNTSAMSSWQNMLRATRPDGYIGCAHAVSGTDFMTTTSALRLPAMGIAGDHDSSTPPDLVRETLDLIPGSSFHIIQAAGHLPCVEQPEEFARLLRDFIRSTSDT